MKLLTPILLAIAAFMSIATEPPTATQPFPVGNPVPAEFASYFTGRAWLQPMVSDNPATGAGNVTFEPGCRNNWHTHPLGQILLCTAGEGWYQEEGKPAQALKAGDVVSILPHVKHWHGAKKDSWFTHIAITPKHAEGAAKWLEAVSDEHYNKLP